MILARQRPMSDTTLRLQRPFYTRDAPQVARDLLGSLLVTSIDGAVTGGRIIETEAYLPTDDLASHSRNGPTRRNRSMFLIGGYAYVYFIYGMYYCFNVVTGQKGSGEAVLIRAIEPTEGLELMRERRGGRGRSPADLAGGPGKLAIALGIGPELDGADLTSDSRIWIEPGEPVPPERVRSTGRIGITRSADLPLRWLATPP